MVTARLAAGIDEMRALRGDWDRLHQAGGAGLFQGFAWMEAWAGVIDRQDSDAIQALVIEDDGPRLILPLVVQRRIGVRRLRWLGAEVTDHCDAVGSAQTAAKDLT